MFGKLIVCSKNSKAKNDECGCSIGVPALYDVIGFLDYVLQVTLGQ